MLDAYIIEQLRNQKEQEEWQPLPLTLELPNPEDREEEAGSEKPVREPEAVVIRF